MFIEIDTRTLSYQNTNTNFNHGFMWVDGGWRKCYENKQELEQTNKLNETNARVCEFVVQTNNVAIKLIFMWYQHDDEVADVSVAY